MLHTFSRNYIIPDMSHHPPCIHKYLNMWPLKKLKCQHSCTHIFVRAVNYHLTLFLTTTAIAYSKTSFQLVILKAVLALLSLFGVRLYVCSFEWIVILLASCNFPTGYSDIYMQATTTRHVCVRHLPVSMMFANAVLYLRVSWMSTCFQMDLHICMHACRSVYTRTPYAVYI